MNEKLVVKNLRKTFVLSKKQRLIEKTTEKVKVAVNDLSFTAYEGEIYGLLGPNGAGKTTTLRIISTLIKADSGDALVDGISVKSNPEDVRGKIGFLTGELKLEDFYTPNYLFDYFSHLHDVDEELIERRKEKLFNQFGITKFKEVKIGDLSTGMKQKIALVISIVHDPNIIIFDEPTNGLDIITSKTVTDFLIELKNAGKTIILSTHIFSLVEKICDRVGIIINGKMVTEDTLENLTKEKSLEDKFFEIYNQVEGNSNE
ncbi:MAG: ATP-binding cassette domain-containing protein [Bacilli bacterium]|nr:ATP-binding cassette domain-containing protein [Bacilli bacterium]